MYIKYYDENKWIILLILTLLHIANKTEEKEIEMIKS